MPAAGDGGRGGGGEGEGWGLGELRCCCGAAQRLGAGAAGAMAGAQAGDSVTGSMFRGCMQGGGRAGMAGECCAVPKQKQQKGGGPRRRLGYRTPPPLRTVAFPCLVVNQHSHASDAAKPAGQRVQQTRSVLNQVVNPPLFAYSTHVPEQRPVCGPTACMLAYGARQATRLATSGMQRAQCSQPSGCPGGASQVWPTCPLSPPTLQTSRRATACLRPPACP